MIKINNTEIPVMNFPDGTLHLSLDHTEYAENISFPTSITWCYDNDAELFALEALTEQLRENGATQISLELPYIPHARMDRVHEGDVFTLKTFAKIINRMEFKEVLVYEAHSNVSLALLDRVRNKTCKEIAEQAMTDIAEKTGCKKEDIVLFFPDEGAMKRYMSLFENPYVFGMKKRDWKTGVIQSLEIIGDEEFIKERTILIVDDISSRGGTFYFAAKALKEKGAKNVSLYVTHCENTILTGEVIKTDLLDGIYTTDSIFTDYENEHSKRINIIKRFR